MKPAVIGGIAGAIAQLAFGWLGVAVVVAFVVGTMYGRETA